MKTKTMKCLLRVLTLLMVLSISANGQTKFGLQAGLNSAKLAIKEDGASVSGTSSIANFHVKAYVDFPIANQLSLQPGIALQGKGGKDPSSLATYRYQSLDIPVNVIYHFPLKNNAIFLGTGIFMGMNLSGTAKLDDGESIAMDFSPIFDSSEDDWKRYDYGFQFLGGYKLANGFFANLSYTVGIANLHAHPAAKRFSRLGSIGLGYEF